jgi:uncharacterized membrane protein YidH (DUF202 family)
MNETSLINTDGLGTALTYIADKIGITVEQMYRIYVAAQFTQAVLQIIFILIWAIAVIIVVKKIYVWQMSIHTERYDRDTGILLTFLGSVIVIVFVSLILSVIYDASVAILCPEYTALQSLMKDIVNIATKLK